MRLVEVQLLLVHTRRRQEIGVGEHAPLRRSGGARRVHERGEIVGGDLCEPLGNRRRRHFLAPTAQLVEADRVGGRRLEENHVLERRAAVTNLLDLRRLRGVLTEHQARPGVDEHVSAFPGGIGVIDRRHHRAGAPCPAVGQRPVGRGQVPSIATRSPRSMPRPMSPRAISLQIVPSSE